MTHQIPGRWLWTAGVAIIALLASLIMFAPGVNRAASAAESAPEDPGSAADEARSPGQDGDLPNVVILDGGGTITSTAAGRADYTNYAPPGLDSIAEVLDRLQPEISEVADIRIVEGAIPGSSARTTIEQLFDMTHQLDGLLAERDVDAVVVNTGTNIMAEIAYWSDLTVQYQKPVIFTGSMRQSNTFSFDGEANLFNAIRLAASDATYCYGTVVLMNDEYVAAREMTKYDAWRTDAFGGGRYGALGTIDGYNLRNVRAPARVMDCNTPEWKTPFDLSTIAFDDLAQAEIVFSYVQASAVPITALADAGVDGIVTAGHGAGGVSTAQSEARTAAVENGVTFVTTTRTGSGSIYPGDEPTPGVIAGYDLTPQKARVLLQLALTFSDDEKQIREWFDTIGAPSFTGDVRQRGR